MTESARMSEITTRLRELEDPKIGDVNARHGDDHSVNLTKLRALAKELKGNPELALELWDSKDSASRLLALLIIKPRTLDATQLDTMLHESRTPKVQDWLVNYVVKKSKHAEELRLRWLADSDPNVSSAGWALTSERVVKKPDGLDLDELLESIHGHMAQAPERLQWAMNQTLAQIGIKHPAHRERAIAIGEELGVLKDYPTPPNCTSPYAPVWINEMVRRAGE